MPKIKRVIRIAPLLAALGGLAAFVTMVSPTVTPASAVATTTTTTLPVGTTGTTYYLSLGDSLSQGYQPTSNSKCVPGPVRGCTKQGYVDDIYKAYDKQIPGLTQYKLGCPGETTGTMLAGGICGYNPYSNQLAAAEAFLQNASTDGYKVAFITIDIGANDVDGCENAFLSGNQATLNSCLATGLGLIQSNLPTILTGLENADSTTNGGPGAPIFGMNYYDPFLAAYLLGSDQSLALETVVPGADSAYPNGILQTLNGDLASDYSADGIPTADVQDAFSSLNYNVPTNYTPAPVVLPGPLSIDLTAPTTSDPVDVQAICGLSWMCSALNIHADKLGYSKIALAFENVMGYLGG